MEKRLRRNGRSGAPVAELVADYSKAVVTFIDDDGYPMSVPANFAAGDREDSVVLYPIAEMRGLYPGRRVNVVFSRIRPVEGMGYIDRRYVTIRGAIKGRDGGYEVRAESVGGWSEAEVPFFEYCERSLGQAKAYMEALSREKGQKVAPKLSFVWKAFLATRVPFLSATVIPVALGTAVARSHGHSAWWLSVIALIGASLIHLGLNMLNDVCDTASGTDEVNVNPTPYSGGSRVIQYGLVSRKEMLAWSIAFLSAGAGLGLVLAWIRGPVLLLLGVAGLFLAVFYSAPPIRLSQRGLGEAAVALGFGPIVVEGSYYVAARSLSWEAFYAAMPVAILVMLILYVNEIPDRKADAATGKRTLAVRLSPSLVLAGYAASAAIAFALIIAGVAFRILPVAALAAVAPAPMALSVYRGIKSNYDDPYGLMPAMGRNIALHGAVGSLLVGAYALTTLIGR